MAFAVVYDACVLYPSIVRDVLIRVAIEGTVRAHWSDQILDEVFRNLKKNRPDLDPAKLNRTRSLMNMALEDANVTGYESIIDGLALPDPDDRHVLAAAIRAGAQVIVTDNLKHFPSAALDPFGISAKGSDDFLVDQYYLSEHAVRTAITLIVRSRKTGTGTEEDVYRQLERAGVVQLAALLRG
jgi:predicted nucleic acid-binding protein